MPRRHYEDGQVERVAAFITQLSNVLPALVQGDTISKSYRQSLSESELAQVQRLDWGGASQQTEFLEQHRVSLAVPLNYPPSGAQVAAALAGLDSLRQIWPTAGIVARRAWFLRQSGLDKLTGMLLVVVSEPTIQPAVFRFAQAALHAGQRSILREDAEVLTAVGYVLTGFVSLAQGHTAQAITALFATARTPRTFVSLPAARILCALVAAERDSVQWLKALTLQHLETIWPDSISQRTDKQLRALFDRYSTTKKILPDLAPEKMTDSPVVSTAVTLDRYLDRQWMGIYDRSFPVHRAPSWLPARSRLIVVEYMTGLACGGCWEEDRGLQALLRRYPEGQVLPLAYHNWQPVVSGVDSLWYRFMAWYPIPLGLSNGYWYYAEQHRSRRLPSQLLVTSMGDTVSFTAWVHGHGLARDYSAVHWTGPAGESQYRRAVNQIDPLLQRNPDLTVHLGAILQQDSVHVTVTVDTLSPSSIARQHSLVLRIVLFQDTVWMYSGTIRRIYTNVVRAVAMNDTLSLGLPIRLKRPVTVQYGFDIAASQDSLFIMRDPVRIMRTMHVGRGVAEEWHKEFTNAHPDPRDWQIDRNRLRVVAMVQDFTTGDILGAAQVKVESRRRLSE